MIKLALASPDPLRISLGSQLNREIQRVLSRKSEALLPLKGELSSNITRVLAMKSQMVGSMKREMEALDPKHKLRPGFVQLVKGEKIATLGELKKGERVSLQDGSCVAEAIIDKIEGS